MILNICVNNNRFGEDIWINMIIILFKIEEKIW